MYKSVSAMLGLGSAFGGESGTCTSREGRPEPEEGGGESHSELRQPPRTTTYMYGV